MEPDSHPGSALQVPWQAKNFISFYTSLLRSMDECKEGYLNTCMGLGWNESTALISYLVPGQRTVRGTCDSIFHWKSWQQKSGICEKEKSLHQSRTQDGLESKTSSRSSRLKASTSGSKNGEGSSNFCDKPWRGFLVNWVRSSGAWEPGRDHL